MAIFREELFNLQDIEYKKFTEKLIPNLSKEKIIGIRIPVLRKFAKEKMKNEGENCKKFFEDLPHKYFEENSLHAVLISELKDYERVIELTEKFLPYIDNWSTCDIFNPKVFKNHPEEIETRIKNWIKSDKEYTIRFGVEMLLNYYLDENFKESHLEAVADIKREEYYVNMIRAWYFCEAIIKQYESAIIYIENKKLDKFTHNKSIQKCIESFRIDEDKKEYLKSLKIK